MEINAQDIRGIGCKNKCNEKCQCSSIAGLFAGLWSNTRSKSATSLDSMLSSWGCMYSSCCAMSSLYSTKSFALHVEELVTSMHVDAIYEALETISGIENIDIRPNSKVVSIRGSGILGKCLNLLLGMGYSISKIILEDQKKPIAHSMDEEDSIEMMDINSKETENEPLLESISIESELAHDVKLKFKIGGMTCGSCSSIIQNVVAPVKGVLSCEVNLLLEEMVVKCPSGDDLDAIARNIITAVEDVGFTAEELKENFSTDASVVTLRMTCASCVGMVESSLMNTKGVISASVNLLANLAIVTFDPSITGPRDFIESVSELGFGASLRVENAQTDSLKDSLTRKSEIENWKRKFFVSLIFTLPLVLITMVFMYIPGLKHVLHMNIGGISNLPLESVLAAILATPVQFYSGREFYVKAWKSLRARAASIHDMEVLVSMGSTVAYVYSMFSIIKGILPAIDPGFDGHHFFETSAALICFVLLGRYLENMAKGKTSQALVRLMDLKPKKAVLVRSFRTSSQLEEEILSDLIKLGDIMKVVPGSSIPADGVVEEGYSSVNESMITGESASVSKKVGSHVIGGTINNEGLLFIKATKVGANSTLSQIVKLVEEAQASKPPIQAFADKITGYFVPCVVGLAIVTWLVWYILGLAGAYPASWRNGMDEFLFSLMFGISVLVVSCPCALGLATPTAVMVGTGVGANLGLLIKGGRPLEMAQKVNAILFDKTGTLTIGNLQVTDFVLVDRSGEVVEKGSNPSMETSFLSILGSAESASEHPIGKSIFKFCKETLGKEIPHPSDFTNVAGRGLKCQVGDSRVVVGNRAFLVENTENVSPVPSSLLNRAGVLEEEGKTCIFVAIDGFSIGLVALSDVLKPEARRVINLLRKQGNEIYMVTGDNRRVANHVGKQLGIEATHIYSEVTPKEKSTKVKELQRGEVRGGVGARTVCFVGDGVNDSVALSQADMGIALGTGTDVAMECADIVLMKSSLADVATALDLARTTFRRIRMNFAWALVYNSLAIPLAAGALFPATHAMLPPMVAGFAMAISSVSVVLSSLLLRLYKPPSF